MKSIVNPYVSSGKRAGLAYAAFMGYPRRDGQWLHYECYRASLSDVRARLAAVIKKARATA